MLLANKNYTEEANIAALKVFKLTKSRHAKWIANQKYLLDQKDVDDIFSRQGEFCDSVILKEEERISDNQRLLLECEASRVYAKRRAYQEQIRIQNTVLKDVAIHLSKSMRTKFLAEPVASIFNRFPDFNHFLASAYSPSLTFIQLESLLINDTQLRGNVLAMVNNPTFCLRLGKAERALENANMAIGRLGIENSRLLFPVLMAKPLLKWGDAVTKNVAPKLWQDMIITANVTRLRLQQASLSDSEQGIMLGVLRSVGKFALSNHFSQMFEDSLVAQMQLYRDQNRRDEYYTCADIKPNLKLLPNLIEKFEALITQRIIESLEWNHTNSHLKTALLEDLEEKPVLQRSNFGVALAQGVAYSMYDTLNRSKAFMDKQKPFLFAHTQMPAEALKEISAQNRGKIELIT